MTQLSRALSRATEFLSATSDTPRLDAELLMAAALGIGRDRLILDPPKGEVPATFSAFVERRGADEPVAYITGQRAFWTIDLEVGPGALVPRPDSETLIAAAVEHFAGTSGPKRILDLGTGPGTLLLAALDEWPAATGLGIDASPIALGYAQRNAERLGLSGRAALQLGDWGRDVRQRFDLILCNPPYVAAEADLGPGVAEYEPAEALFAGADGLDDYRRLAPQVGRLLAPGGLAAIEIGSDQAGSAAALFTVAGHRPVLANDLGGRPRALLITV
ncbi:MAG: peptide chain release factor N(5)-glutamine methyltransferase [Sphingomonas sp.]|uniref:peptide chain release factor N(5)-glutamine methyltransferase n=1 Tax=Sphingomonas sp. TaxID=28214 RepID=UPI0017B0989F|nr:peptide chain release factor N(5)-glutamine methyltransferase [Sphingomonas sp.]MBA3668167.1 peptide chain release factor N(5)-glutamine methyltransferase [Sphingomonas sp.]